VTRTLAALLVVGTCAVPGRAQDTDLVFGSGPGAARLRIDDAVGENAPGAAWSAFLDKLFAYFDRDGDGTLSEAEVKRVFPLSGLRAINPNFAAMDANRDGKVSPAEFRAFYRAQGFAPVVVVVAAAPERVGVIGNALFTHLDRDGDSKLSAEELKRAPALLKRFDENEDEVLTADELLGPLTRVRFVPAGLKRAAERAEPAAVLTIGLDGKAALATDGKQFQLQSGGRQLRVPGGVCAILPGPDDNAAAFREARKFFAALFRAAAGDKPATKSALEADPTASVLVGMFDFADRDGDGKLTRSELDAFFDLIEIGVSCSVTAVVTDRGRNLFDLFDADGDGCLDLGELNRAAKTLSAELTRDGLLARETVPASYRIEVTRGPITGRFGPVEYGTVSAPKKVAPRVARGPAWFRAMDKNGDGYVSEKEFVGSPERFAQLDTDGDGRISVAEAEAAKP
jgi:Ca2+-binding EF-hand superfamily protein